MVLILLRDNGNLYPTDIRNFNRGGEGVNHVKRDWLEIFNVNCDLYLFFCVKRDWGYLRET